MRKIIGYILSVTVIAGLLSGCGGEYAGITEGDAVSGSAVSGEAVSGGTVSGNAIQEKTVSGAAVEEKEGKETRNERKPDMGSHRFCTDTNLYYVNEYMDQIMQAWTDGTHRKCIRKWESEDEVEIICVDTDWLYYDVNYDDGEVTYRAPIEKDEEGQDVVRFQKAEKLVRTEYRDLIPIYADADYYFYSDQETGEFIKYDLKRKKKVSGNEEIGNYAARIVPLNDHYFCSDTTDPGCCYVQEKDSGQWEKICDRMVVTEENHDLFVSNGREIFYPRYVTEIGDRGEAPFEIMGFDGEKERQFVAWKQVSHAVQKATGAEKLDVCMPNGMFWQEGRLYLQIQTGWLEEGLYHMGYMVFSQGKDGSGLRYEKKLTECMKSHVKEWTGKWFNENADTVYVEHMAANDAQCIAMVDGTAYLSLYDYGRDKGRLGCYDLDTGEFRWITREDAAFYKLGWDDDSGWLWLFGEVFCEYAENTYTDVWYWYPSKDKDYEGHFEKD